MVIPTVEVLAERERCVIWCEHMAQMLERSAERLRKEGTYTYRTFMFKKQSAVHPGFERAANTRSEAAKIVRQVKQAITEGLTPKPLTDGH